MDSDEEKDEDTFNVHDRVKVKNIGEGTVRFIGEVEELGDKLYYGIELDDEAPNGNDGSIKGKRYFNAVNNHGLFTTLDKLERINIYNGLNGYIDENTETIDKKDIDPNEVAKKLKSKINRRPSQVQVIEQGVVPQSYFDDPIFAAKTQRFSQDMVAHHLEDFIPNRPTQKELESKNVVPDNYFDDPMASTKGQKIIREIVSENLEDFYGNKRPSIVDLQTKNIIPKEYIDNEDINEAQNKIKDKQKNIEKTLNEKLDSRRRPTITDLGDMHIIPHDYLDILLEDAVQNHQRKQSRMQHVQDRLQKHLPEPVAFTLAETLVNSVQEEENEKKTNNNDDDEDNENDNMEHKFDDDDENENSMENTNIFYNENEDENENDNIDNDPEWQITFTYEPMRDFKTQSETQKTEVTRTLERRLSRRPSKEQIEIWGLVPPTYFENPEQSFLRQALGREIALDLLEGFFPQRQNIHDLTNRGVIYPDFITQDHDEAMQQKHQRKQSVIEELKTKLNPNKRPSIAELGDQGIIPENWLLDLYGLADSVRKKHKHMKSAVDDLRSKLNVPPVLADVVARDVLEEIETVDPYLDNDDNNNNNNNNEEYKDDDDEDDDNNYHKSRGSVDLTNEQNNENIKLNNLIKKYQNELKTKNQLLQQKNDEISKLKIENNEFRNNKNNYVLKIENLTNEIDNLKKEHQYKLSQILSEKDLIEKKLFKYKNNNNDNNIDNYIENEYENESNNDNDTDSRNSKELHRLDSKAIEIQLTAERMKTQELKQLKKTLNDELIEYKHIVDRLKQQLSDAKNDKIKLIKSTNTQIDTLRSYLVKYQQYARSNKKTGILSGFFG